MEDKVEYYRNQISIARTEIKNLRQQLLTLKHEHQKEIQHIKASLNKLSCANCAHEATTLDTNRSSVIANSSIPSTDSVNLIPIGYIETSFQNKRGVPRQPNILTSAQGTVVIHNKVFTNPEHALIGLKDFSHMWLLFYFHSTESTNVPAKVSPPRLAGERLGVFATRSPHRPCPIGLSLVKITGIEGNKVHFQGVDMVNGTPVLDIKPYIPQYDYPSTRYEDNAMSSLTRPPTEGISDVSETLNTLRVNDSNYDGNRLSPSQTQQLGIDANSSLSRSPFEDNIPSLDDNILSTPMSPSPDSPSSVDLTDGSGFREQSPTRSPNTERGAPDGQERFTPPQPALLSNLTSDGIRVAPWISNPPSKAYQVQFTDDALARLNELIGDRAQAFKDNIECLLSEDPRSHYVRSKYPDHNYSCVLEDLSISCVFNSTTSICTIVAVRSPEELQQN